MSPAAITRRKPLPKGPSLRWALSLTVGLLLAAVLGLLGLQAVSLTAQQAETVVAGNRLQTLGALGRLQAGTARVRTMVEHDVPRGRVWEVVALTGELSRQTGEAALLQGIGQKDRGLVQVLSGHYTAATAAAEAWDDGLRGGGGGGEEQAQALRRHLQAAERLIEALRESVMASHFGGGRGAAVFTGQRLAAAAGLTLAALMLSAFVVFRLYSRLVRPLESLAGAARQLDETKVPPPVPQRAPREVGDVAVALQELHHHLTAKEKQRRIAVDQLRHQATHDPLTGVANRRFLLEHLSQMLDGVKSGNGSDFAVLFLDLDRFKVINDSLGHIVGDKLLRQVSGRMRKLMDGKGFLARIGGDEFVLLLPDTVSRTFAEAMGNRVQARLCEPYDIAGRLVFTNASIGVVISQPQYACPEDLLRDADTALYSAKAAGRGRVMMFEPAMHETARRHHQVETELRKAVADKGFRLVVQPVVDMATLQPVGFESLVRPKPGFETVGGPAGFIPLAEETGLIVPLGRLVLEQACLMSQAVRERYGKPLWVSVNVSPRQLLEKEFAQSVDTLLTLTGTDPRYLKLEVTETAWLESQSVVNDNLAQLRALGCPIFLDDFGSGYSSLSHLQRLQVDGIKLDYGFTRRLPEDAGTRALTQALITFCKETKLALVAEGVETAEQLSWMRQAGIELGQGFLFSRPVPLEQIPEQFPPTVTKERLKAQGV